MMKKVSLEEISKEYRIQEYSHLYEKILELIKQKKIKPVKASGTNGKKPALFCSYWVLESAKDYSIYENELQYEMVPSIQTDYYLQHLEQYIEDREWVLKLNRYLKENRAHLQTEISENERSFAIWHREKFLKEEQGKKILKRCGIEPRELGFYETSEPVSYYVFERTVPQNMLIIENKDTFYTFRKYMMQCQNTIFGIPFGTLIYGAGKGILRSFRDFEISAEPYMLDKSNRIYYFGDMDYEGILIYESFAREFGEQYHIRPFAQAYRNMVNQADVKTLPAMKKGQNQNIAGEFFTFFDEEISMQMKQILQAGKYIPQEIINIMELRKRNEEENAI